MDSCARAFDLGKATGMHTPGTGSLPSLVCVAEQGGCRRGGLAAAVQGCSVPCLHTGGSWRPADPFFVGKWQLWEGGLIRLYGHQGDEGWQGTVLIAGLWGQQDRNAYNTPPPVFLLLSESATPGCISAHVCSLASSILLTPFHFW